MSETTLGIPDSTRDLSVEEIKLYSQSVINGWHEHFTNVLSGLSPDMLRVIAHWCLTVADEDEPAPVLGAATYGWTKQKLVTRNMDHLPAANMARLLDAKGMPVPAIADELAKNAVPRGDGRVTWEQRAIVRLVERERGRRFLWDVPRVKAQGS